MVNEGEWKSEDKYLVSAAASFFKWKKKNENKIFIDIKKALL